MTDPADADAFIWSGVETGIYAGVLDTATEAGAVIRARFRMSVSEDVWVGDVSRSFPDATLRLLTGVPRGERALELGEIRAGNARTVAETIRNHPDIFAYDRVYASERRTISQYETAEQGLYKFLWETSLPPEFAVVVEDGQVEFGLTATREQFEAFGAALDDTGRQYDLLSVVHTDRDGALLTDRQRECLAAARREGYFEVPRECTLAELADSLGVDKSTASETVRRGTARVVAEFLASDRPR